LVEGTAKLVLSMAEEDSRLSFSVIEDSIRGIRVGTEEAEGITGGLDETGCNGIFEWELHWRPRF
jgi:hypothetical protein